MRAKLLGGVAAAGAVLLIAGPAMADVLGPGRPDYVEHGKSCYVVSYTRSATTRSESLSASRDGLATYIKEFLAMQGWSRSKARISAKKATPNPSLRSDVPREAFFKPDSVSKSAYTQCWEGVIAPAICTSGALVCK